MNQRNVIAFFTGQSDPAANALSDEQRGFLDGLSSLPDEKLERNFPYHPVALPFRKTPLLRASLNNSLQYLRSRRPPFAATHRDEVIRTFDSYHRVIFLAGSCGLELFSNLGLPAEFRSKTHIFAYGPVSRSRPRCATLWLVQGNRDPISRWWHPRPDHFIDCHHMNYLGSPALKELFLRFYQTVNRRSDGEA